jgi:MFS family permease
LSTEAKHQAQKLWSVSFVVLILITFSNSFCFQMLNSTLALYVESIMPGSSVTGTVAGIASLIFTITIIISRSCGARFLEMYGRRPVAVVGAAVLGVGCLLNAWIPTVAALLILRAVQGIGAGAASTTISIANIHVVPTERLSEGMGKVSAGATLSMIIGPSIALMLIAGGNYRIPFYAVAVCCVVTIVGSLVIRTYHDDAMRKKLAENRKNGVHQKFHLGRLRDMICVEVLLPSLIQFFVMVSFASFTTYLTIYANDRGYTFQVASLSTAGAFFALASVVMVVTQFFFSHLGDKYGPIRVAIPGMASAICGFLLLTVSHSLTLFFVAAVFYGIGSGLIMPVLSAATIKGAPQDRTSLASSTFYILYDAGLGIGALVWGVVRDITGVSGMYAGAAVTMAIAAYLTWYVYGKKKWLEQAK